MQILVVESASAPFPCELSAVVGQAGWAIARAPTYRDALHAVGQGKVEAALLPAPKPGAAKELREFDNLLRILDSRRIATLVLSDHPDAHPADARSLLDMVPADLSAAELRGRLAMIARYHGLVQRLEQELQNMERLGKRLNLQFRDIDQELRLAGRLQRDFLPNTREPLGNLKFASVFRPATWVSGDMFDVFRIDEDYVGVYIADAVGHGLAAGLLTMSIKRAIVPKRIDASGYSVLSPSEIMTTLNHALADQSLPQCQFVTACYALINQRTLEFQYARGGHPYPVLVTREGIVSEVKVSGGLLGITRGEEFLTHQLTLQRGDKIVFYTDGVEFGFGTSPGGAPPPFLDFIKTHATLSVDELMACVERHLDAQGGSLHPQDDVSLIGFEVR